MNKLTILALIIVEQLENRIADQYWERDTLYTYNTRLHRREVSTNINRENNKKEGKENNSESVTSISTQVHVKYIIQQL